MKLKNRLGYIWSPYLLIVLTLACSSDESTHPGSPIWTETAVSLTEGVLMSGFRTTSGKNFVVGGSPTSGAILMERENKWQHAFPTGEMMHWVHGHGTSVWSVGAKGTIVRFSDDGEVIPFPEPNTALDLWGIWVFSPTNIWVVGGDPRAAGTTQAVILHFDGELWTNIALPDLDRPCPSLFKVWGQNSESLYFVGANGVLLHWNGESIQQISVEIGDDLVAVWGNEEDVIAVGGRIRGVILHSDGNEWQTTLLPTTSGLNGIMFSGEIAIAVGHRGFIVRMPTDDPSQSTVQQPTNILLHGIFQSTDSRLIAVGGTLDQPLPWAPILLESEGDRGP